MPHYVAIVEEDGADKAVGIWFPDLPGCFSGGDDLDDALRNAPKAIGLYADSLAEEGRTLPSPRSLSELRQDPEVAVRGSTWQVFAAYQARLGRSCRCDPQDDPRTLTFAPRGLNGVGHSTWAMSSGGTSVNFGSI